MKLNKIQEKFITEKLNKLRKSKFRSSFHLTQKDKEYIKNKGLILIEKHCLDFINTRLKPQKIKNDGKQTPISGHPVFIAQHATATCCRSCLLNWHKISKDKELTSKEINFIKALIISWIIEEMKGEKLK